MMSDKNIQRLIEGNARFAAETPQQNKVTAELRKSLLKNGQKPFAAIVGCSDSRVPVEMVFDAGPGELFVIRTAGVATGPMEIGSLELAIEFFKIPLIVVLGHQACGAVCAAVDGGKFSGCIEDLVNELCCCTNKLEKGKSYDFYEDEIIHYTIKKIESNPYISKAISEGRVKVAGAKYSQETGIVTFF